ncbi:SPOR domain-containing protein [Novosphingobium sp. 9]|uniref:SPOR domain-containing protein n=1 Tax=Novosphingobium sp. 9 TaxID=2025349 RepID=UPI0021B4E721|nr:SPOR domain-containing protein [Novosphingobium sp. 9]
MKLPVNHAASLATVIALATGGIALPLLAVPALARDHDKHQAEQVEPTNGPAADYPVVIGDPFTIGTTTWTPSDQLNYDAVGYASVDSTEGLVGVSAAHKTLPLPSYVEVTALDSGRTILLRLTKRGPMSNDVLVGLSPDAAAQLGIAPGSHAPVRVRRVIPPEQERALLRADGRAPERMATPDGLLRVLRRKLAEQSPLLPPPSTPPTMPSAIPTDARVGAFAGGPTAPVVKPDSVVAAQKAAPKPVVASAPKVEPVTPPRQTPKPKASEAAKPTPKPAEKPAAPVADKGLDKGWAVQVGAFSSAPNAKALARKLGGSATASGKLTLVRMGPFASRAQAAAALEKAKSAGYSDARIVHLD